MSTLLLNADANPISYIPLSVLSWQEAITFMTSNKATALEFYEDWIVRSERWGTRVPAVLMLNKFQKPKSTTRFSKANIFLRDDFTCQYCGIKVNRKTATLDHVIPTSHGGRTIWENTTTACGPCNARKGNNKKIVPKIKPFKPNYFQLVEKRRKLGWENVAHPSWRNYLEY